MIKKIIKKIFKKTEYVPIYKIIGNEELLKDKVILITGGSGGIGFAIAKKCIECGAKVVISGTNEKKLSDYCTELGNNAKSIAIDIKNVNEFNEKIKKASLLFGKLDILICSHGVHTKGKKLEFLSYNVEEYDNVMDVNLRGTYFLCQEFSKYVIENKIKKAHIMLVSSSTALEPAWSPYRLSKWGIKGFTKGLAQSLLRYDIIVNSIAPGSTATKMLDYNEGESLYTTQNTNERYTTPEEIAEYAVLLISNLGNTIIGDTIYMSGGRGIIDVR